MPFATALATLPDLPHLLRHSSEADLDQRVIVELRLPRTLLALIVGAGLGVSGSLIQGHTRNPLADPGIIGVSAGAALAVVVGFAFFGINDITATAITAFLGAIAATALVFGVASISGSNINPLTLILGGAALSAVLGSITSALILSDDQNLNKMRFWTTGSVAGRDLTVFWGVLPLILCGILIAFTTGPKLNLLNLGDDIATSLGVNPTLHRIFGILLISLLAGAATAAAGPLSFIGLVIPHISRAICGPDYRWILPNSALCGSILLLVADIIGRIIARPDELQVGIVLAFVGAPFFMYLIYRNKVKSV